MPAIEYQTFSELLDIVQPLIAPEDLGEEMQAKFRREVGNALADIQTLIPWVRDFNVSVFTKNEVQEFCSTSVFQGPVGKVTSVFAYKPGRDCKKLYYKRVTQAKVDCWIETQRCVQCTFDPPPTHIYDTPYCNYVIHGEEACDPPYLTGEEDDCLFLSLDDDDRMFAVGPDYKIYAAPRFPCGYYLLLNWQGIKRKWEDTDLVPVDQQLIETIQNRVEWRIARKERSDASAQEYYRDYMEMLRTLRYRYHDEQDPEMKRDCTAAIEQQLSAFSPLYVPEVPFVGNVSSGFPLLLE